jgi:hypothetical protein
MPETPRRISRLRRLAGKHGYLLRRYRHQPYPESSWDLIDVDCGGAVFGGLVQGYYGTTLDEVEAWLSPA